MSVIVQYIAQYMAAATPTLLQKIATRLRELRQSQGWSQQTLAELAKVSRRMLAAVEGGQSNVSLATLDRLASALGVTFADLILEPTPTSIPTSPVLVWQGTHSDSQANLLQSLAVERAMELWNWSLAPGDRYTAEPDRPGTRELIYVIAGILTLEMDGQRQRVDQGESVVFPSDQPYSYLNEGPELLRFIKNVVW